MKKLNNNHPIKKVMDNPTKPIIIEGRPFTPNDLQHLDELNEEMLKQNPPKPYQWKKGMLSHLEWEELYLQRPIILDTPTEQKD